MIGEIGNFNMKKLLLILLCLPMIGFGQTCFSTNNNDLNKDLIGLKFSVKSSYFYNYERVPHHSITLLEDNKVEITSLNSQTYKSGTGVGRGYDSRNRWWVVGNNLMIHFYPIFDIRYKLNLKDIVLGTKGNHEMMLGVYGIENISIPEVKINSNNKRKISRSLGKIVNSFKRCIKLKVEQNINEWQQKGEYEKTVDYLERINEKNRNQKIEDFQNIAILELQNEFLEDINLYNVELGKYDADNETYLLNHAVFGKIILNVPTEVASSFKGRFDRFKRGRFNYKSSESPNWLTSDEIKKNALGWLFHAKDIKLVVSEDKFILSELYIPFWHEIEGDYKFGLRYNITEMSDYAITDIDYEFSPIVLDDITSAKKTKSSNISTNKLKVGTSSVNINIPSNKKVNNRYALIIGNEDYQSKQRGLSDEQNVDYAVKDASIFQEYALKTLGVKEDNMFFLTDATSIEMNRKIKLVSKIIKKLGSKAELIVYYAGHGYPDETTKVPYLIPVDVPASDLSYAIKLDDFYKDMSATGAKSITVFLDACFTGGGRESGLMASRGVKVKPKEGSLSGNLVVFSASSGNQSALPYHQQGHGMFTYYLLKKLQESKGKVTMGELADYISNEVSIQSLKTNEKEQDPKVNASSKVINDWRNWKF